MAATVEPIFLWLAFPWLAGLAAAAAAGALVLHCARWGRTVWASALLLLAIACLGAARLLAETRLLPPRHIARSGLYGEEITLWGRVADEPAERSAGERRFVLELSAGSRGGQHQPLTGRILVTVRDVSAPLHFGDRLRLRARVRRPDPARNPGAFDYRAFLAWIIHEWA